MNDANKQIFDIYDVWYEPLLTQSWFITILILFLTIFVALVVYFIYTRYFNRPVKVDCLLVIQQKIKNLSRNQMENERDGKRIYFDLAMLMKEYIAYRYGISVAGLTDQEIVKWADSVMPEDQKVIVKQLLVGVTSIKFEYQIATLEQVQTDIALMQGFIEETTPKNQDRKET